LPDTPGDILERVLPMILGFIILSCSRKSWFWTPIFWKFTTRL